MADLTEVIEDAITDVEIEDNDTVTETAEASPAEETTETEVEAAPEAETTGGPTPQDTTTPVEAKPEEDKFAKEFGLPSQSASGRENRIPYSRVKAIVDKAQKKAVEPLTTKLTEFEAKVSDYERRLEQVGQFEQIMVNDPQKFLQMLSTLPAYKQVFESLLNPAQHQQTQQPAEADPTNGMPQPNQKLADGTMVYDMEGLKALMAWQAQQVEQRVSQRYQPIEEAWRSQEQINQIIPQVQRQVEEARKWPLFTENEADIVTALQKDQTLSLERAYQQVVYPKLVANKDKVRQEVLSEIKARPGGATSAPSGGVKPGAQATGPRSTTDIIRDSIKSLR